MRLLEKIVHIFGPIDYSSQHKNKHNFKSLSKLMEMSNFNFKISKFMNIGVAFSIVNIDIGKSLNKRNRKITNRRFGFLFLVNAEKNKHVFTKTIQLLSIFIFNYVFF